MTEPVTWADTPAARIRATLGVVEPEFPSDAMVKLMTEARGHAPAGVELRDAAIAEASVWHRHLPVVVLPDTRSPMQKAWDTEAVSAQTSVQVLDDAQVNAAIASRQAAMRMTIRPGDHPGRPYWSAAKNQGTMMRAVAFGGMYNPSFEDAVALVDLWQAQDQAEGARSDAALKAAHPGHPR